MNPVNLERERCAQIIDNLARVFANHKPDPNPRFNTPEATMRLAAELARIAASAIREPQPRKN